MKNTTISILCAPSVLVTTLLAGCAGAQTPAPVAVADVAPSYDDDTVRTRPAQNTDWWPQQVDLAPLRQNHPSSNPLGASFDYAAAFEQLDLQAVKADIEAVLTDSQDWWPADYGNYGPFFVRMAWHSAGTYRVTDGRGGAGGGQIRFEPLNSWPDNANLDKARRLLEPVKQKYGASLSWADLMVLTGNVAMESMGFETLGFAGGREDDWEADLVYWGPESEFLDDERYHGDRELQQPLAAVQMGLIYVNPQGPNGNSDPISAAQDIRETFGRMAMNDTETVALIAGGHTFGKAHGAYNPEDCVDVEPAAASVENQGMGWNNSCGKGNAEDTVTSGLEGAWTSAPVQWTHQYLSHLHNFEWEQTQSPAGATQWRPTDEATNQMVPDAHVADLRHAPMMFTTDLALKEDPAYNAISLRFHEDPEAFEQAFAEAWFKLTHRDLGPRSRYLGSEVPEQVFSWQDPIPTVDHPLVNDDHIASLKEQIAASDLTVSQLVRTAWSSASTYRNTDRRGGANGARIRFAPQQDWAVNDSAELELVLGTLMDIQQEFNQGQSDGTQISVADLIVLAGAVGIEKAAAASGQTISVPFVPGRADATEDQTDEASFAWLEPQADGFRNYYTDQTIYSPTEALIDRAALLGLTVPEMTALIGGMRALDANADGAQHGVWTDAPGTLSNDFFVNLLDMSTTWQPSSTPGVFDGKDSAGETKWTATEVDLVFGSNSELRAIAESYTWAGGEDRFVQDFVNAWTKVMQADRFDLHR